MSLLSRILFPLVMVFCDRFQGAISTSQEFQTTSNLQDKLNLAEREIIQLRLKQSQSEDMVKIVTAEMKNLLNIRLNMEMTRQRNLAKVPDMRPLCRINQIETTTTTTSGKSVRMILKFIIRNNLCSIF